MGLSPLSWIPFLEKILQDFRQRKGLAAELSSSLLFSLFRLILIHFGQYSKPLVIFEGEIIRKGQGGQGKRSGEEGIF
jgi:hypothetical protein